MKTLNRVNVVEELREIIRRRFRTQTQAARMLGMSPRDLSRALSVIDARTTASITIQLKLLERLGYEVCFSVRHKDVLSLRFSDHAARVDTTKSLQQAFIK